MSRVAKAKKVGVKRVDVKRVELINLGDFQGASGPHVHHLDAVLPGGMSWKYWLRREIVDPFSTQYFTNETETIIAED